MKKVFSEIEGEYGLVWSKTGNLLLFSLSPGQQSLLVDTT